MPSQARQLASLCRKGVLAGVATVAIAGCSPTRPAQVTGANNGWPDASAAPDPQTPRQERWDLAGALREVRPAGRRTRSEHLGGEFEGEVMATAGALPYPKLGPESEVRAGATVIERLFDAGKAAPVAYFVMIKRPPGFDPGGKDWEYMVVAPDNRVELGGKLVLCARCHAEAPCGGLFGPAR